MNRKLITACAAVAAFAAFSVMPAFASAANTLTENGVPVAVGAKVTATNSGNIVLTTSSGNVTCSKASLTGTVTKNDDTTLQGTVEKASFTGTGSEERCTSTFLFNPLIKVTVENLHYCIEASGTKDTWSIVGKGCNEEKARSLKFTLDVSLGFSCTYERAAAVTGTYETNKTPAPLTIGSGAEFTRTAGGSSCPEKGTLSGKFTLETDVSPFTGLSIS